MKCLTLKVIIINRDNVFLSSTRFYTLTSRDSYITTEFIEKLKLKDR